MNDVMLIGRVGQDPKVMGEEGHRVARFTLATTERGFETKSGKRVEERTEWHTVVFFGNICSVVEKYVRTGGLVCVKGSIHYSKWEDPEKNIRYNTEIWGTDLQLLGSKKPEGATSETSSETEGTTKSSGIDLPF